MNVAHTRWYQIFEVVFGIPFLIGIAFQLLLPLSLPYGPLAPAIIAVGAFLVIVGVTFVILARRELASYSQPTDPGHPTSQLVTTGVFSISRNPLYIGGICILLGSALALNLPWVLVLLIPGWIACHYILILPEEKYLASTFGKKYLDYAATVHRWIGRSKS